MGDTNINYKTAFVVDSFISFQWCSIKLSEQCSENKAIFELQINPFC